MKEIKYNTRVYIDRRNSQVMIRVRWNKKEEAAFALKCKVEIEKWDETLQRARFNTIHKIGEQKKEDDTPPLKSTFVCCSLAMGIPPAIVMSCTGHKDYESMKPYIEVADETQQKEMPKWNAGSDKDSMLKSLESIPEDKLLAVLKLLGVA